jgi:hypothetical protein
MKKYILVVLGVFMVISNIEAKKGKLQPKNIEGSYSDNNTVSFVERGIKFHLFLNGGFDFNTRHGDRYFDYNAKRIKRTRIRIKRDFNGQIKQIGSVFINYDYRGNVSRIGNVFMQYRHGNLTKVGGLKIAYNQWGNPRFFGQVKNNNFYYNDVGFNYNIHIRDIFDYNDAYFYRNDFRNNYVKVREDTNFYYYKAKPNTSIGKRSKILKRRKQVTRKLRPKRNKRNANNSYKKQDVNKEGEGRKRTKGYRKRIG